MYCKVTHPIPSYAAAQQQCQQLDQLILNLQTPSSDPSASASAISSTNPSPSATNPSANSASATPGAGAGAPDAQLPGQ